MGQCDFEKRPNTGTKHCDHLNSGKAEGARAQHRLCSRPQLLPPWQPQGRIFPLNSHRAKPEMFIEAEGCIIRAELNSVRVISPCSLSGSLAAKTKTKTAQFHVSDTEMLLVCQC